MLIFQPHIPHMITNSWWPLHVENYTSEGSVSISTCDFVEVTVSASTVDQMLLEYDQSAAFSMSSRQKSF